jgi:hypothetical protein
MIHVYDERQIEIHEFLISSPDGNVSLASRSRPL